MGVCNGYHLASHYILVQFCHSQDSHTRRRDAESCRKVGSFGLCMPASLGEMRKLKFVKGAVDDSFDGALIIANLTEWGPVRRN